MAHFARIDNDKNVIAVIVIENSELLENGKESENKGIEFCKNLFGQNSQWVQTSYNASFRKRYAGIGDYYDETRDAFIPKKPFDSWSLNETSFDWEAPIPYPNDGKSYSWDENSLSWIESKN